MSDNSNRGTYATKNTTALQALEEGLNVVDHEDPDKHLIGASLGVAPSDDIQPVGVEASTGDSIYPARANHTHAIKAPFSVANISGPLVIPNTGVRTYVNNWANSPVLDSEDWIGGTPQTLDFTRQGLYILGVYCQMIPDTGANMGPGYLKYGITFSGVVAYGFATTFIENGQADFFYDVTHFHVDAGVGYAELWFENNCPVNQRITSMQFVGSFISTT